MHVRDATAEDADAVAALAGDEVDAGRLIRDRSVLVGEEDDEVVGFVAFDTWRDAVHVTRFDGEPDAIRDLLDSPREFATRESLPVEMVVPEAEERVRELLSGEGFEDSGPGPMFEGERTRRFRWTP